MSRCLKGKRKAQKQLYNQYSGAMFMVCLRYANSKFEAEDFLQEGFVKLFQQLKKYDVSIAPLGAWMKTLFIRVCLDQIRKKRSNPYLVEINDELDKPASTFTAIKQLQQQELVQLIQQLPEGYRNVFNLYVIDGYKHKEIASLLNISESTSKSQLFKARKQLQESIIEQNEQLVEHGE